MAVDVSDVELVETIEKTVAENLPYGFDWTDWLAGDTINSSAWTVPTGITAGVTGFSTTATSQRLSGGTVGNNYLITNAITTVAGNVGERTMNILVVAKKGTGEVV